MILNLLRCQGFAVDNYSATLGRLEAVASSTFETSGEPLMFHKRQFEGILKTEKAGGSHG